MWLPIIITVLAASGNNIGKVLQKQATRTLPRLVLQGPVLSQYFNNKTWLIGMSADLAGALLMIAAFALAPVSVVQPVSAVGLVILLIFSHFYLKEKLRPREWASACVAFAGVLGLGVSSEPDHLDHPDHMHPMRIIIGFGSMVALLGVECWWRHGAANQPSAKQTASQAGALPSAGPTKAAPSSSADAVLCGLEGGACFGFSAAACRTGFILARRVSWMFAGVGLASSVLLTSSGFVLQTRGLKAGNTVVVCTMAAVSSMITGVVAGLLALGEKMPTSHHMRGARLASWIAILVGVSTLAGGQDGLDAVVRAVASLIVTRGPALPPSMWRMMPRPVAAALHRAQKRLAALAGEDLHVLPVTHAALSEEPLANGGPQASANGGPTVLHS